MTDQINEKIGAWLLKEGNSRSLLAEELGISRPALLNRLNGSSKWNWDEVLRLSQLLGCSLNELAGVA